MVLSVEKKFAFSFKSTITWWSYNGASLKMKHCVMPFSDVGISSKRHHDIPLVD